MSLSPGKVYPWQIQAQDLSGNPIGENNGLSEISVFNFIGISILPSINVSQQMGYYTLEKSVNTNKAKIGDELTYTIYIKRNLEK